MEALCCGLGGHNPIKSVELIQRQPPPDLCINSETQRVYGTRGMKPDTSVYTASIPITVAVDIVSSLHSGARWTAPKHNEVGDVLRFPLLGGLSNGGTKRHNRRGIAILPLNLDASTRQLSIGRRFLSRCSHCTRAPHADILDVSALRRPVKLKNRSREQSKTKKRRRKK